MTTAEIVTNFAGYQFAVLSDLKEQRKRLLNFCKNQNLKGTILLSEEGINMFIAGRLESIEKLISKVREIPGLENFEGKFSDSDHQPFRRMLVRIKKEIIAFGVDGIEPGKRTSPKLQAKELKQWLDEGRKVTLLDTRNDYEVKLGTFKDAVIPEIDTFRDFPNAVRKMPEEMKDETIVMFCTGGIRCEKAGPFMEQEGFKNIYQLDGGILKYFEECGGDHYDGECFVFDQRVGVDPALKETDTAVCYACQAPLDEKDREDVRYVEGVSCPYCFVSEPEKMAARIAEKQAELKKVTQVLPGSIERENRRPVSVPARCDQWLLPDFLVDQFPQISRDEWLQRIADERFISYGEEVRTVEYVVRAGERLLQRFPPATEPDVATEIEILHDDEAIVVLKKPAPLPMHASGRYHKNTLQNFLNQVYQPKYLRPVHRLDANTSGLLLFGRTRHFCNRLQQQFLSNRVEKVYTARVHGSPEWNQKTHEAKISREPSKQGGRQVEEDGLEARTDFTVRERHADGTTTLDVTLHSGRTNQIRVHLWDLGYPIVGDPCYLKDGTQGDTQTLQVDDQPMELIATKLAFNHPVSGERMVFDLDQ